MDKSLGKKLLAEQLKILDSASGVLEESRGRVSKFLSTQSIPEVLTIEQKESCEALTARFARLCDFLFQRVFRTIDQIELVEEGSGIDRLNRMEKRGVIDSASDWREYRELRNEIAHEYLIEKSDRVLLEALQKAPKLIQTVQALKDYVKKKSLD